MMPDRLSGCGCCNLVLPLCRICTTPSPNFSWNFDYQTIATVVNYGGTIVETGDGTGVLINMGESDSNCGGVGNAFDNGAVTLCMDIDPIFGPFGDYIYVASISVTLSTNVGSTELNVFAIAQFPKPGFPGSFQSNSYTWENVASLPLDCTNVDITLDFGDAAEHLGFDNCSLTGTIRIYK